MKKILIVLLLFCSNVFADTINLLCNKNKKLFNSGTYPLIIDIQNKTMTRAYTDFELQVSDNYFSGLNNNGDLKIILTLNRLNLELEVSFYKEDNIDVENTYKTNCFLIKQKI